MVILTPKEVALLKDQRYEARKFEAHIRSINEKLVSTGHFDSTAGHLDWVVPVGVIQVLADRYRAAGWGAHCRPWAYHQPHQDRSHANNPDYEFVIDVTPEDAFQAADLLIWDVVGERPDFKKTRPEPPVPTTPPTSENQ